MKNIKSFIFSNPIWRWDNFSDDYAKYTLGEGQWQMIQDKLILTAQDFVKSVFSYGKVTLTLPEITTIENDERVKTVGYLESKGEYYEYIFNVVFGKFLYSFKVINIPILSDTYQIEAFFTALLNFLSTAYLSLESNLSHHQQGHLLASYDLMRIADFYLLNFSKTVMIEYLYYVLNIEKNLIDQNVWDMHDTNRYNIELLEKSYTFANELSSRKIENKEIYTGFIFHDSEDSLIDNSIKRIKLEPSISFGDFSKIKNLIPSTNGKNIFFNVTKNEITHVFKTRDEVLEISMEPVENGKNFFSRPLIVSIQGEGKIFFIQGHSSINRLLFQMVNNKPIIKNFDFIKNYLTKFLSYNINDSLDFQFFINWLLSVPIKKKGTTVVLGDFNKENLRGKLVHYVEVSINSIIISDDESNRILLDSITNPDGALIFNKQGELLFMSAILPFSQGKKVIGGGARHQSAVNFTSEFHCVALTVSEDGNISVFNNGKLEIKF